MALCIAIFFSYSVCGGALLWLLRSTAIETDENRRQVRAGDLERSRNLLLSVRESLDLREAERRLKTERLLSIDPDHLSPEQFENYVAAIFSNLGYTTEVIGKSGDQGVDVVACSGPIRIAIQAKRYTGSVGNFAVQEVYTGMAHHKCHRCLVVTTSDFTPRAVDLVSSTNCLLIGRDQLRALIRGELAI
jgi:restriction system protein